MNSQNLPPISLPRFEVLRLRAVMRWHEPEAIPGAVIANVLRGAVGIVFRKLVCPKEWFNNACHPCPLFNSCDYGQLFAPKPNDEAGVLQKQQDAPRPFVIEPPGLCSDQPLDPQGFQFRIVLFGKAIHALPIFVAMLQRLCGDGIGVHRTRLDLLQVVAEKMGLQQILIDSRVSELATPQLFYTERDVEQSVQQICVGTRDVLIRFTSPLLLRTGSYRDAHGRQFAAHEIRESPPFHVLVSRMRDRLSSLSAFFGQRWHADFKEIASRAEQVSTIDSNTVWISRARRSTRTGHSHEISGLVGSATYRFPDEAELRYFWPLLKVGELIHVGKNTPWGNGAIQLEPISCRENFTQPEFTAGSNQ